MTDIIRLLDEKDQEQFMKDTLNEYNAITDDGDIEKHIAELNATNTLLISVDDLLRKAKTEKNNTMLNLQNSEEYIEKYKTLKQREQMAQIETDDYQYEIIQLEKRKPDTTSKQARTGI